MIINPEGVKSYLPRVSTREKKSDKPFWRDFRSLP